MCDTFVALPHATANRKLLFAKNSDRERNEAQLLEVIPRRRHPPGATVELTYVSIPQAAETNAVLLSRPFWMWGAEMGANEHGVVIGNEAMHAIIPAARRRALLGMDLVRLGLERANTAAEAVDVITALLERYGQGGNCGHYSRFYYQNGFLVADAREAFVLETVGRWWVVERVRDVRALSNAYSIGDTFEKASRELVDYARSNGRLRADERFDFANAMIDADRDRTTYGRGRCARGTDLLKRGRCRLSPSDMMAILRDHGPEGEADPSWHPADTVGRTICMHAAQGKRRGQTTGSLISEIHDAGVALHWVTGTSAPCTSIFKPLLLGAGIPSNAPTPTDRFDPETLWWRHEILHRCVLRSYPERIAAFKEERDALEKAFIARMADTLGRAAPDSEETRKTVEDCWREAWAAEEKWLRTVRNLPPRRGRDSSFLKSWSRLNRAAAFPG